jgi:hypothetical protein
MPRPLHSCTDHYQHATVNKNVGTVAVEQSFRKFIDEDKKDRTNHIITENTASIEKTTRKEDGEETKDPLITTLKAESDSGSDSEFPRAPDGLLSDNSASAHVQASSSNTMSNFKESESREAREWDDATLESAKMLASLRHAR